MRSVIVQRRHLLIAGILSLIACGAWLYWNRPERSDLSSYAPADALAIVEVNDLAGLADGVSNTQAWKMLAGPVGSPETLSPNHWLVRLARWTGVGSTDTVLFARSQVAVVFSGAEGTQTGSTLTIKPLATLIIDTHTSQRRMRGTIEHHIEELAKRVFNNPVYVRKQIDGNDFQEWQSTDNAHLLAYTFVDNVVIVGNDEGSILHCLETRAGKRGSMKDQTELATVRGKLDESNASLFGFVTQPGVKSLLQAFVLYRSGPSPDAATAARIFSDTVGGLIRSIGWTTRFVDGGVEDRCEITLVEGVAEKLQSSMVPDHGPDVARIPFVPNDVQSVSVYQFRDTNGFWNDLNATLSSHTDLVGAVAARPLLRALVKPYGIDDADAFARAVGPRLQTIRLEKDSPAVLVAEVFDRPALLKAITQRFGKDAKTESISNGTLLISSKDNWAAAFVDNTFLVGPLELVRKCVQVTEATSSLSSNDRFRKAQQLVDVSLPLTSITFSDDQQSAISFVEALSKHDRPAFASNGLTIDASARSLPFAVSTASLKGSDLQWTSRSAFGLMGSLAAELIPAPAK